MGDPRNPVRDVMSSKPISIDEKLTLRSLAAVLAGFDIGLALTAAPDGTTHVVSERDVVRALADGAEPDEIWAADITSAEVVYAQADDTILDVAHRMTTTGVRHVVIVEGATVVGIVSARDVLPVLTEHARSTL